MYKTSSASMKWWRSFSLPLLIPFSWCLVNTNCCNAETRHRRYLSIACYLCQDVRRNQRLTALLPYLVTFIRVCLNRYKERPGVYIRLIRYFLLISSKPVISYCANFLLSTHFYLLICVYLNIKNLKD